MSTFAVFGMTHDVALAEAKKKVSTVKDDLTAAGGKRSMTMAEWMEAVEKRAAEIMAGSTVKQLSPMFDAPQFAEEFIALARKTLECRDMHIKLRTTLTDATGRPITDSKTGAPKTGWLPHGPQPGRVVAQAATGHPKTNANTQEA
ncbi:hypothetical protein PSGK_19030 [Pseudomonas solani]|uniref:hypothetical protein n=1 Tax=Pseudomonas solani TaxID=2731552 RepID=UPI0035BE39CD